MSKTKMPTFKSEDEEREFWATHDSTDFVDWNKAARVIFPILSLRQKKYRFVCQSL